MRLWIEFRYSGMSESGKTKRWDIYSIDGVSFLGRVQWYSGWRKYCFNPAAPTVFEQDCLRNIARFVEEQTILHKKEKSQ